MKRAVVVGAGILGTWHALELSRHGYAVQHLEADPAPTGASVRNFGLIWVGGRRNGEELEVAHRARRQWEEIAASAPGIGFRANGSITVAVSDGERKVMEEFAHHPDAGPREIAFLEPHDVVALNPAVSGDIAGGLHCRLDAAVEPRRALGALRTHLQTYEGYEFHPGHRIVDASPHAVVDRTARRWEGDLVVVATGAAFDHLPGTEALAGRLRRVRLQMLETEPYEGQLTTSLADGDSLRYYPAYSAIALDALGSQSDLAAAHHMQLLLVQRLDGGLTIGDTHAYEEPFDFALSEEPTLELLNRAERLLGTTMPPVRRRWEGIYAQATDGAVCVRHEIQPGVVMVTGPGGRGMTCAPAIATDTLALAGVLS